MIPDVLDSAAASGSSIVRRLLDPKRYREIGLIGVAAVGGVLAGLVVAAMGFLTNAAHVLLFGIPDSERLSGQSALMSPWLALVPVAGGAILAGIGIIVRRRGLRAPVDPIEANALHGGRMAVGESLLLAVQTMISSGFGASVGLEAGYTQVSASLASRLATMLRLRRGEVRMLVGCAAAGAISAAFGAPITGAFYGFELIIGTYTISLVAPVLTASLVASLIAHGLGAIQTPIEVGAVPASTTADLMPFIGIGIAGGIAAVAVMQLVTRVERLFRRTGCPAWLRPLIGGAAVGGLALVSPHILSSGHGALHVELASSLSWQALLTLFALKSLASALSLGSGFRGGLFFASLYLGAVLGKAYALAFIAAGWLPGLPPVLASVVGMASLAVGIVGGPMTMTFLVLETTGDLAITGAVLAASIVSSVIVRETFGYSFSTWRLHLRGETIRSAHDVGWMRNLTVGRMMRPDAKTVTDTTGLASLRAAFPLGSTQRVIAVDADGRYAGMLVLADAYAPELTNESSAINVGALTRHRDVVLLPTMTADQAAKIFETAGAEELAVIESPFTRKVVGLLTEQHLLRRYAEELDKARRDLTGEG